MLSLASLARFASNLTVANGEDDDGTGDGAEVAGLLVNADVGRFKPLNPGFDGSLEVGAATSSDVAIDARESGRGIEP